MPLNNYNYNYNTNLTPNLPQSAQSLSTISSASSIPSKQDPKKLIKASFECIKKILELDTQSTISDFNLLETVNSSSILKFKDIENYIDILLRDSEAIKVLNEQMTDQEFKLKLVEDRVSKLVLISEQLEEWSRELEVKSMKYREN